MERKFKILQPIYIKHKYQAVVGFSPEYVNEIEYKVGDIIDEQAYQELIGMGFNESYEVLSSSTKEMMRDSLVDYVQEITIGDELLKKILKATKINDGGIWYSVNSLATYGCNDQSPMDFMKISKEESDYLAILEKEE